jgi:hypothetical protein
MSTSLNIELEDLPSGLPQLFTNENSNISGKGLGIVLVGRLEKASNGPVAFKVIIFRGLEHYDSLMVTTVWKETRTDTTPFKDVWHATGSRYVDRPDTAYRILLGLPEPGFDRTSPAL